MATRLEMMVVESMFFDGLRLDIWYLVLGTWHLALGSWGESQVFKRLLVSTI